MQTPAQFQFADTAIEGVKLITLAPLRDDRGWFLKTFHAPTFRASGLESEFPESFVSLSKRNVIRGMHFQRPPHDHAKIVRCLSGRVLDVALDIRSGSRTCLQHVTFTLDAGTPQAVYMPRGIAHGFLTLSEEAVLEYHTSTVHHPASDCGIRWDSFGFDWPLENEPILSLRDRGFAGVADVAQSFGIATK
jgi:dTDP-4-dehydrorhamnose 3,5-epimerase